MGRSAVDDMVESGEVCEDCPTFIDGDSPGHRRRCEKCERKRAGGDQQRLRGLDSRRHRERGSNLR